MAKTLNDNDKTLDFSNFMDDLESSTNVEELENLFNKYDLKRRDKKNKYPELEFIISKDEIETLKNEGKITNDNKLEPMLAKNGILTTTLEKLLYSIIWKNGGLGKESHIISGVLGLNGKSGIVYNQFGKYLSDKNEIIIDRHVMRAYILCKKGDKRDNIKNNDYNEYLDEYKEWIEKKDIFNNNKRLIDELLFQLDKKIGKKRKKG